jgi:FHS family L-fucose permease-like MFS transporter
MIIVSSTAILLILAAIFFPESIAINFKNNPIPIRCFFLVAVGLFMSVMWGGIFNLSVEGLGKYTEVASGLFMTMVVGGGILPLLQDFIAKSTNHMTSYWLVIGMLGYILFYSLIGCKNVNKDIPVD